MKKLQPKYPDGSTVLYGDCELQVIDSYWKNYDRPGWFYNLNDRDCQAIPEHQLSPAN